MSRELIAAQSGWGKSWLAQQRAEEQIKRGSVDHVVVLDHEREFHGLSNSGPASWIGVGDSELRYSKRFWASLIKTEQHLVVQKAVGKEDWMKTVGKIGEAAAVVDGDVLLVIDEAHFVAPLRASVPDSVEAIATTGRGRGVSSIWITQRLAKLDTTVSSQCDQRILGGFTGKSDLARVGDVVDYPREVHNPQVSTVVNLPDALTTDVGESVPVQKTNPGSEWIYSDRSGDHKRIDTSEMEMDTPHLGASGATLTTP